MGETRWSGLEDGCVAGDAGGKCVSLVRVGFLLRLATRPALAQHGGRNAGILFSLQ